MNRIKVWLLAGAVLLGLMSAMAQAQTNMRVRDTITSFDGHVLEVKTREGNDLSVNVADNTVVSSLVELQMGDIRQGSFVGVTAAKKGPEGAQYALEVHVFPEASRGTGEGHYDWDLGPGTTMTNANVDAIVERNDGEELTLGYKGGMQKIIVPPDAHCYLCARRAITAPGRSAGFHRGAASRGRHPDSQAHPDRQGRHETADVMARVSWIRRA